MAQNQTLQHKRSATPGSQPTTSQVAIGELAINFADKSIYTQTPSNTVIELARDVVKSATQPSSPADGDMWYDTTNDSLYLWDGNAWTSLMNAGKSVLPANTTASPTWSSGSGTSASPYVFTITSSPGAKSLVTAVTVTGLAPGQFVPITDSNSATNGARFTVTNNLADASGVLIFNIIFNDVPTGTGGTTYTANMRVGTGTVYITVTATLTSVGPAFPQSVNSPTNTNSVTTSWTSAADTLTSTGDLRISLDGVTYSTGPLSITTGATLYTKWTGSAGSGLGIDGANGATITGAVVSSNGGSTSSSLTIDKTPSTITFAAVTGAGLSTATSSSTQTVSGVNSYVYLTSSDTVSASVAGGAFTSVLASGTSLYVTSGQTLQLRQTSSATVSTTTTVTVTAGGGSTSFAVTTVSAGTINTPSITSPVSGSTGVSSGATLTSSAYAVTGVVGTHLNTDWEIYTNSALTGAAAFSSLASTTNKTTWTPVLGYSTQYWARVRYRSNDGVAIVSSWSPTVTWTTGTQPGVNWTYQPSLKNSTWGTNVGNSVVWSSSRSEYLVVGTSGSVATSPDGITWTYQAGLTSTTWATTYEAFSVVWSSSRSEYLVVGASGRVATSPDGVTWTDRAGLRTSTWGTATPVNSVVWSSSRSEYLVVGASGRVATSPDGITWTYQSGLSTTTWGTATSVNSVVWSSSRSEYLVVGASGRVATSPDGVTWTYQSGLSTTTWGTATSVNSVVWSSSRSEYLVVGLAGKVATSPDGITWTYQPGLLSTTFSNQPVNSVAWNGAQYLVAGGSGRLATSSDGITWTYQAALIATTWGTTAINSVAWNGAQYVVVGQQGKVGTSP